MISEMTREERSAVTEALRSEDELSVLLKTFPRLIELGHETVFVTYSGSGDSGDEFDVKVEGMTEEVVRVLTEEKKVCEIRAQYQRAKNTWEYTFLANTKPTNIIILDAVMRRVSSAFGGWELNEGSHGTAFINLATGRVVIEHTWHTESQDSEHHILAEPDLVERKDKFFSLMPKEVGTVAVRYNPEEDYLWLDGDDLYGKKKKVCESLAKAVKRHTRKFWKDKDSPEFLIRLDRYAEQITCWIEFRDRGEETVRHSFWFADAHWMNERNNEHDGEE